jgi:hypothetical protein
MRILGPGLAGLAVLAATLVTAAPRANAANVATHAAAAQATTEWSGAKRGKRALQPRRERAYRTPAQIACTRAGCGPVPPGCYAEQEIAEYGPTGFEMIVCPQR